MFSGGALLNSLGSIDSIFRLPGNAESINWLIVSGGKERTSITMTLLAVSLVSDA